ncbi:unnamed protein product [Phaedon cochleariae]|uniref:RING-type domain-containing protein n=1 Tax=Phaedon cochleariae TaxID=80249 RepID=A0A9P0DQ31_PHACE|nr:unnamed protein product [Phaedon cochleariae]
MNINCVICSDLFVPSSEVHITQCGHMFHFHCLISWLERSKSCPQCRQRVTEKTLHRVYFNLANAEGQTQDVGTLLNKIDDLQYKLSEADKDKKAHLDKIQKLKKQHLALRTEVTKLEHNEKVNESTVHALKQQISYFKSKAKDSDRLTEEIVKLKNNIKDMENVQIAINGTRDQANEMIKNQNHVESLAIVAAMLKKNLLDAQQKKREADQNLKRAQHEAKKYKKEYMNINSENSNLKREIQQIKTKYEKEKQLYKTKYIQMKQNGNELDITNTSLSSDHSLVERTLLDITTSKNTSLPIAEKVQNIVDSESPYLPVKSKAVGMAYGSILSAKFTTSVKPSTNSSGGNLGYTIFKSSTSELEDKGISKNGVIHYNGLGGSSKEDIYPSPKPIQTGLKRNKTSSTISSNKFRKLAPGSSNSKVTDHFKLSQ